MIGECHASRIHDKVAAKYRLISGLQDREQFIEFCLHSVLYQMPSQGFGTMLLLECYNL